MTCSVIHVIQIYDSNVTSTVHRCPAPFFAVFREINEMCPRAPVCVCVCVCVRERERERERGGRGESDKRACIVGITAPGVCQVTSRGEASGVRVCPSEQIQFELLHLVPVILQEAPGVPAVGVQAPGPHTAAGF
jgi:hypothetical protein